MKRLAAAGAALLVAAAALLFWYWPRLTLSSDEALRRYRAAGAEAAAIDPLVLAGERAVEPALRAVVDLRRGDRAGLLRFLGNGRYAAAQNVLERLVDRESEPGYLRCEALFALERVNRAAGLAMAVRHKARLGDLGNCAQQILAGIPKYEARTYHQARRASLFR